MGRIKGSLGMNTIIKKGLPLPGVVPVVDSRTDDEILNNIIERF